MGWVCTSRPPTSPSHPELRTSQACEVGLQLLSMSLRCRSCHSYRQLVIFGAATNNFGDATVQRSDGVRVDVSAPVGCVVSDGPDAGTSLSYQSSDTAIQATWQGLSDVESGIAWLEVGVGTGAGAANTVAFFPVATDQTSVSIDNLALDSRTTYYVTLRATYVARLARCRRSRTPLTALPSPVQESCRAVSSVLQLWCPRGFVGSSRRLCARHSKRRV